MGWKDAAAVDVLTSIAHLTWSTHPDYARRMVHRAMDVLLQILSQREPPREWGIALRKILGVAGRYDPPLVQQLVERFEGAIARQEAKVLATLSSPYKGRGSGTPSAHELMSYAAQLAAEQPQVAAQLAELSLRWGISADLTAVVARLRQGHPDLAARVLQRAIEALERNPYARVEDAFFVRAWILDEAIGRHLPAGSVARYFEVASRILERAVKEFASSPASAWYTYFLATKLLPLYDRYAHDRGVLLRSRLSELQRHPEVQRELERQRKLSARPREPGAVEVRLARARAAPSDKEHDQRLIALAADLARKRENLERALDVLEEVRDRTKRAQFQEAFVLMAIRDLPQEDWDQARSWILRMPTPIGRARAWIHLAEQKIAAGDREAARAGVEEAVRLLSGGPKTPEWALVWLWAAMVAARTDPEFGFETLNSASVAANEVRTLRTLELAGERVIIEEEGFSYFFALPLPLKVEVDRGFEALARSNVERALLMAQSFAAREIRARALIAVAAALLSGDSDGAPR